MRHDTSSSARAETLGEGSVETGARGERVAHLDYVRQMLVELRRLSAGLEQPVLSYLIEMAAQEASDCVDSRCPRP